MLFDRRAEEWACRSSTPLASLASSAGTLVSEVGSAPTTAATRPMVRSTLPPPYSRANCFREQATRGAATLTTTRRLDSLPRSAPCSATLAETTRRPLPPTADSRRPSPRPTAARRLLSSPMALTTSGSSAPAAPTSLLDTCVVLFWSVTELD